MSFLVQQFNNANLPNYIPGMVLDSLAQGTTGIYAIPPSNLATVTLASAAVYAPGASVFTITQLLTGDVLTNVVYQSTIAFDPDQTVSQLAQAFNPSYNVSYNAGNITITSKFPGVLGQFIVANALGSTASSTPVDALPILPGRIVVPDGTNYATNLPYQGVYVAYPTTTNATVDTLGGLYVTGFGDAVSYTPYPYAYNSDGGNAGIRVGNRVELYTKANSIVLQSITPVSTVSPLFVETSIANSGANTGKITATTSASTVALPISRLRVLQGTTVANGLVICQLI